MREWRVLRRALVVFVLMVVAGVVSGCGMSAEEQAAVQKKQLREYIAQADAWGADIIAQIPEEERTEKSLATAENFGGTRKVSAYFEEWPKYYYWAQTVTLRADARTPTQVADDLIPWLMEQGWEPSPQTFRPGEESFRRDYLRGPYHLMLIIYTEPPPRAQSIDFFITTPQTDPALP